MAFEATPNLVPAHRVGAQHAAPLQKDWLLQTPYNERILSQTLTFTSLQAPNADRHQRQIAGYLAARVGLRPEVLDGPWQQRQAALERGEVDLAWVCGWPYVRWVDRPQPLLRLLGAPVMAADRYQGRPIYFSDVVVRRDSDFRRFGDLAGTRWAYNEPGSHSGYNLTGYELATRRLDAGFFGDIIEAGSHERALRLILRGEVDASAIDSTVLETELRADPGLAARIRRIAVPGPSPAPPYVVPRGQPAARTWALAAALASMHRNREGRRVLAAGSMQRIALLRDRDYGLIREMERVRGGVELA